MGGRLARDDEVTMWQEHGWVVLKGLIDGSEIDAAAADLTEIFPTPEAYHADPEGETQRWLGIPPPTYEAYVWPPTGPGFRPEQHRWSHEFPFPGSGRLNRLAVHGAIVDFIERALDTTDIRLYQSHVAAKYTGITNYEQPMHTDRNHSWLPASTNSQWRHVETFLYLSDVDIDHAPTHLVSVQDSVGRKPTAPLFLPDWDPELYAAEQPAAGVKGSLLAYRPDVFHRAVEFVAPRAARFLLNVSFKRAGHDWIGYHAWQSRANGAESTAFIEGSTPRELELVGFPPPGHEIWDDAMLDATAERYPNLDLTPWREAAKT